MTTTPGLQTCTVAAVNYREIHGDHDANVAKMLDNIREAGAQGADLVVFPEGAIPDPEGCTCREVGGPCPAHLAATETIPGPTSERFAALARELDLYVVYGTGERDADDPGTLYKAAAVVGPEGVVGTYHKVHLGSLPWVMEGVTYAPGTKLPVFDTRFGRIGVQICYDFWFNPELTRLLALKGAQLIVNCAGSFEAPGRKSTMTATALARAGENLVYTVTSNSTGGPGDPDNFSGADLVRARRAGVYTGNSLITGPAFPRFAEVMAQAGDLEEIVIATLGGERLERWRTMFDWREWRAGRLAGASDLIAREFAALAPDG